MHRRTTKHHMKEHIHARITSKRGRRWEAAMSDANEEHRDGRRGPRGKHGHGPGGPGGRGGRAKRGAVARSILLLLSERPMHGYEIIAELEERSERRWRPSAGTVYPALSRMEEKELIAGSEDDEGKRQYELTEGGRARVADFDPDAPAPWDEIGSGGGSDLRSAMSELGGQARQIGRFGTAEQREAALEVLTKAKKDLYKILAQ